uniref:Uncharacterized protein n=1 Tax=Mustela putorius furo TaxID=9669 RepID=M3XPG5_MUSPF
FPFQITQSLAPIILNIIYFLDQPSTSNQSSTAVLFSAPHSPPTPGRVLTLLSTDILRQTRTHQECPHYHIQAARDHTIALPPPQQRPPCTVAPYFWADGCIRLYNRDNRYMPTLPSSVLTTVSRLK